MPADFHEILFPFSVSLGARGTLQRRTEIVALASGAEHRNGRWADARRRYEAGLGIRDLDALHAVLVFFEERRGRLHGFRFRDPVDGRSCPPQAAPTPLDQRLGTGDGARARFQLAKTYGALHAPYARAIVKPVAGTVRVAVDGAERRPNLDFACDPATGEVTFRPGAVPPEGAAVTAGFLFDVPVRFDADQLEIDLAAFEAGAVPSVPLIEIRA